MLTGVSNEMLFYGGLAAAGGAAVILTVFLIAFLISGIRLNSKFDNEYGRKRKKQDLSDKGENK